MKVLVTGGTGFIGGYVASYLEEKGHVPVILDRARYGGWDGRQTLLGDVRDGMAVSEGVAQTDAVIHLAGVLGTQETIEDPRPAFDTNLWGSLNVFQACRRYKKRCVYITVGNHWMNNPYSISKTAAERLAWMLNTERQAEVTVVRALNAYGPGQKTEPVRKIIPTFIRQCLAGRPIEVYGDGTQVMDMIHVRDVAEILVRALTVDHGQYATAFEAGTGRPTTVNEIAAMVAYACGQEANLIRLPMRPGEPPASMVLGRPATLAPLFNGHTFNPIPLETGLRETVQYYKEHP